MDIELKTRHNLPSQPTSFIGRETEIAEITALLTNPACRLLTLVGPGGIGKTRLGLEAVRHTLDAFPDGAYFVPLQPLQSDTQVVSAIINALPLRSTGSPYQQLLDYLGERCLLLVMDNYEHLRDGAGLLGELLAAAPRLKVLVTSRHILKLREEWVRHIKGMNFPDDQNGAERYDAVDLFVERAVQVCGDFSLTHEREHVINICRLVEGMPLALELAASWTRALSCQSIADEIRSGIDFLTTDLTNIPERHRSIPAVLAHSWALLAEDARVVFRRLAVFRGGFTRQAAEAVAGASLRTLARLVDSSLVRLNGGGRYDIQELLRQYAEGQLLAAGESDATCDAHCRYYADFMQEYAPDVKGRRQLEALDEIEADWNNVRAAWEWAVEHGDYDALEQMAETLQLFCDMRIRFQEGEALFRHAVETLAPKTMPPEVWDWLNLRRIAVWLLPEHRISEALRTQVERILANARQASNQAKTAFCLWILGEFCRCNHEYPAALAFYEESQEHFRRLNETYYMGRVLRGWSFSYRVLYPYPETPDRNEEHLRLTRATGDMHGLGHAVLYEAGEAGWRGEHEVAEQYLQEAVDIHRQISDPKSLGFALAALAQRAFMKGEFGRAEELVEEALHAASDVDMPLIEYLLLEVLGMIALIGEDYAAARRLLDERQLLDSRDLRYIGNVEASGFNILSRAAYALLDEQQPRQHLYHRHQVKEKHAPRAEK
jgi:predicted ATPase